MSETSRQHRRRGNMFAAMVMTPWGDSEGLRGRQLNPGHGVPAEEVARNQRERLYGALVAAVEERGGFDATRVADLLQLSGVSRASFYEHFADKQECLVACVEEIITTLAAAIMARYEERGSWEERTRGLVDDLFALVVAQPGTARLVFLEAFGAGGAAVELVEAAARKMETATVVSFEARPEHRGTPGTIVAALMGGVRVVVQTRLRLRSEAELPGLAEELWEWGLSYPPPPRPLREPRRRGRAERSAAGAAARIGAITDPEEQAERIARAVAEIVHEQGSGGLSVGEITARARISHSTFRRHFRTPREALRWSVDFARARMLARVLAAGRRGADWPRGVRLAVGALCRFGEAEPEMLWLLIDNALGPGNEDPTDHRRTMALARALLAEGYRRSPQTKELAAEAIVAALLSILFEQMRSRGAGQLGRIAPLATYMVLAPFIDAEEAVAVANGDGLRPARKR